MPWVIRRGMRIETVTDSTDAVVAYRGEGAIMFCDASGFTKLTESLAQKPNGAELLSRVLNQFYTPLVDLISQYRGDIIKFSGDALTVFFMSEPEEGVSTEYDMPCGSGWARCACHTELQLATLRATACCIEIHRRLDNFQVPNVPGVSLSFHIGVGCGNCVVLHVGGEPTPEDRRTKRFEYVIAGDPLEQISHACKYAAVGETVLSPQAWAMVSETCIEGSVVAEDPSYHRLADLNPSLHSYATIRAATKSRDTRSERYSLELNELPLSKRYIPSAVYMQMENGTLEYVNEIRVVTGFFMSVKGVNVSDIPKGARMAQDLMSLVQKSCHEYEGEVNKFLVDDKGLMFLCVFGTPPMVHTDDPHRGINACLRIIAELKKFPGKPLEAYFGLTTGRVFCGLVGSPDRQEYTTLGDSVNLAARLMQLGKPNAVVVDTTTYEQTRDEFEYRILDPVVLKGKGGQVPIFQPVSVSVKAVEVVDKGRKKSLAPRQVMSGLSTDPLCACRGWSGLTETQNILKGSNVLLSGGTVVIAGQSGLGRDQLAQTIVSAVGNKYSNYKKLFASDFGIPSERCRPVVELLESALAQNISSSPKIDQLSQLTGVSTETLIESGFGVNSETNLIEVPKLAKDTTRLFESSVSQLSFDEESDESKKKTAPHISIGNSVLSPSGGRGATRRFTALMRADGKILSDTSPEAAKVTASEEEILEYCALAVKQILESDPVVIVLKSARGTSLFNVGSNSIFWALFERLKNLSVSDSPNPLIVVLMCRRAKEVVADDVESPGVHVVPLRPLPRECIEEYVGRLLGISLENTTAIPFELLDFVEDLTQGNPMYIRETLEQLQSRNIISVSPSGQVSVLHSLASINLTEWSHTSMVGRVVCQLEALAPQEAAVVKMASVFEGPFSVLDLAASLKSPYSNATCFDNYRMFRTCARLVYLGILHRIPNLTNDGLVGDGLIAPLNDMSKFPKDTDPLFLESMKHIPMYILDNFLIRKVARGMILHQQALKVKRQALLFRAIHKELPARMQARKTRLAQLDIHYFDIVHLQ
jgi:class 3 adenylate cyclase